MNNLIDFPLVSSEYSVKQLEAEDVEVSQGLYDEWR